MNTYKSISQFGSDSHSLVNHPLSYCMGNNLNQRFLHGGHSDTFGQDSKQCQLYMAQYCSKKWDSFCEIASKNNNGSFPNNVQGCIYYGDVPCKGLTSGEILIHNTAAEKYLFKMHNSIEKFEPFDPTVANSPLIRYWVNDCSYTRSSVPEYVVDPDKIDEDIVMNKILEKPIIAMNILVNIYNTMKRYGTLSKLRGTKLGNFYNTNNYFKNKGGV